MGLPAEARSDCLNVVLSFHQANQFSARMLLELLMSLNEGIETRYYLRYEDAEETLEIQQTLRAFLQHKRAERWRDTAGSLTRSIFQWINQLDVFLLLEPDCVCLQPEWARSIYEAVLCRKQPILGQVHQLMVEGHSIATHFSKCAVYDGAALRKLPIDRCFEGPIENPWKVWGDRLNVSLPEHLVAPFNVDQSSFEYLLFALYFQTLTGSNHPLDWPTNCLTSREDLILDRAGLSLTDVEIVEAYWNRLPILCGAGYELQQTVLRLVRSQGLIESRFALSGRFEGWDGQNPPKSPFKRGTSDSSGAVPCFSRGARGDPDRSATVRSPSICSGLNQLNADNSNLLSLQDLRGNFAGKRCFIIGNGPSLNRTDLSLLKHEFTFGLNRIYLNYEVMGFEPTFYCCVNPNVIDQFAAEIDRLNSVKFVTDYAANHLKNHWNTFFLRSIPEICFNEDLSNLQWHEGWTVTYCAMQAAFHLGFSEVILVGVDHNFKDAGEPNQAVKAIGSDVNHFHPDYFGAGVVWQYPDLERSERSYRMAKQVYEKNDRRILDATVGGQLQIFPKVDYAQMTEPISSQPSISLDSQSQPEMMDVSLEQQEKALLKRHPHPHAIFLPTEKIPYPQRIEGLKRVLEIYEHRYQSVYCPQLKALREKYKGKKRAFVIGNGPSLNKTDLSLLKDEITFGVNGIFLKFEETDFRPTFYVVEDHLVAEDRQDQINQLQGSIKLFPIYLAYCLNEGENTIFYNHVPRRSYPHGFDFSTDASDRTYTGCTVTFSCLQLAYYLGFEEIYLIGVDCDYAIPKDVEENKDYSVATLDMKSDDVNHFHPDYFGKGFRWHDPQADKMREAYQEARKVCEANGVRIYNATVGGKLEVFPRVDYYSLFPQSVLFPRVLLIDLTRIGENTATGQMKQALFRGWSAESLLQVHASGAQEFGLYSPSSRQPIATTYTDPDTLLEACKQFSPNVIYYRPVADRPYLHEFACRLIEQLNIPSVIHIVDDWPERLLQQDPQTHAKFDRSLRQLLGSAKACLSIGQAMSEAFSERYGVQFTPLANCVDPEDWTPVADKPRRSGDRPFTIRYVGSLADDMTLESVLDLANAVAALQSERSVRFEIYTLKYWLEVACKIFAHLPGVSVHESDFSQADYRQMLSNADALLIAYNFDPDSIRYVRYSIANKFPECLAAGSPVLVYGPQEVATVAYAAEIGCVQAVLERDSEALKQAICQLMDEPDYGTELAQQAQDYVFSFHAGSQVRTRFHGILRSAARSGQSALPQVSLAQLERSLSRLVLGEFERDRHAHIDETQIVAEWFASEPSDSIMVDVGAHYGSALKHFAEQNWRVYAYEPDPDNRQVLMQRVSSQPNVMIDHRAVSDRPGQVLPFFSSEESTGISGLSAFRESHQHRCEVMTTTVTEICEEHHLKEIDFLKIDTEGFDLMVLKGVPWEQVRPRVIECEFEDRKTVPLGYTFHDLAQYLVDRGYTVLVSEWHPVIRYGIRHDWYRLMTYPCQLDHAEAWGNLLAFREPPDLDQVAAIAQKLVTFRAAPVPVSATSAITQPAQPTHPPLAMEERNGMSPIPSNTHTTQAHGSNGKTSLEANGKGSPPAQEPTPVMLPVTESSSRLPGAFLRRIARYYSRWPLSVAVLAIALNTAATIDGVPFRWALSAGGSSLILFLVGHAASKGDFALRVAEQSQETTDRVSESVSRAHQKATSAFKRATKANQRAQEALARLDGVSVSATTAMEAADRARSTAEFSQQKTNQATSNARSALETASRALGNAEFALEIANRAKDKADASLDMAEQVSAKTDTTLERVDAVMKMAQHNSDRAETILETANRNAEKVSSLEGQIKYVLKTNSANVGLFQAFDRQLSQENLETFISFWLPTLNLNLDRRALGYLAHRICLTEDTCSGRLATTVQDMLLRILVARSIQSQELSILEIGSLFGINLAILYETCRDFFDRIHLSAIDPLDGYYDKGKTDLITQVPITRSVFEHNMRQMDIPQEDITLIQGLSTDEVVLQQAGQKQYNLLVIDGDHSYQGVKFDFDHYLAAVDVGGYIIFDDYSTEHWPEVADFVDQEVKSNPCVELVGSSWRTAVFRVVRKKLG